MVESGMRTLVNDLIGKLEPEQPERKKDFKAPPNPLESKIVKAYRTYVHEVRKIKGWCNMEDDDVTEVERPIYYYSPTQIQTLITYSPLLKFDHPLTVELGKFITDLSRRFHQLQFQGPKIEGLGLEMGCYGAHKLTYIGETGSAARDMRKGELVLQGNCERAGKLMQGGIVRIEGSANVIGPCMKGGRIDVRGNVQQAGFHLEGGIISVSGDVDEAGFYQREGTITVDGRVIHAGQQMAGGTLTVKHADVVGKFMQGGTIHVLDSYKEIPKSCKGTVYFKNKLIIEEGKCV
jgi:hypothetical protein